MIKSDWSQNDEGIYIPVGLAPDGASPLPTTPSFLRSKNQDSVLPSLFFSVKAKMDFACLMASFLALSSLLRASSIMSKAFDAGKSGLETGMLTSSMLKDKR